jgi:hypothetical protein
MVQGEPGVVLEQNVAACIRNNVSPTTDEFDGKSRYS